MMTIAKTSRDTYSPTMSDLGENQHRATRPSNRVPLTLNFIAARFFFFTAEEPTTTVK